MKKGVTMSIEQKIRYTNTAYPDKTFESDDEFFTNENCGNDDSDSKTLESHTANNNKYHFDKTFALSDDKKSVLVTIDFTTEEDKTNWAIEKAKLPAIDKNLKEEIL